MIDWSGEEKAEIVLIGNGKELLRKSSPIRDYRSAVFEALGVLKETRTVPIEKARMSISVVGHRVVHGGTKFQSSVALDPTVKEAIRELSELAPLHNPPSLEAIEAAEAVLPGVPQVAVFDTTFFSELPPKAYIYPVPYQWFTEWGIRRFGFHGISHNYCAERVTELLNQDKEGQNLIICHLGNGCSATAVRDGKAIATTMGFTPLEGLMMGSRSGSIDPGILLHAQKKNGLAVDDLDRVLNNESGLLGVSGVSSDFREVEQAAKKKNARAQLALDIYADRVRSSIGSLAVTLGNVGALIFTGGVGENSASLRVAVCEGLQCRGIFLDGEKNRSSQLDADIATKDSKARILAIHTQEEFMIAREAANVFSGSVIHQKVKSERDNG